MSAPSKQEMDFLRQQIQKAEQDLGNLTAKAAAIQQGQSLEQQNAANKSAIASLQIQISSQQNYLAQLTSQYAPLEEKMKQLQMKNTQDAASIQGAQAEVVGKQSNISFLQSMFTKMVQISNNYAESNGVKINENMVCADIMPPEHLVHTSVFTDAIMSNNKEAFDLAVSKISSKDINHRDSKGKTLLMYAAANAFTYGIEKLLEKGANPDLFDEDGCNALFYAASTPHIDSIRIIASKTKDINHRYPKFDGNTSLHMLITCSSKFFLVTS
jgi:ankyrin repeat protein